MFSFFHRKPFFPHEIKKACAEALLEINDRLTNIENEHVLLWKTIQLDQSEIILARSSGTQNKHNLESFIEAHDKTQKTIDLLHKNIFEHLSKIEHVVFPPAISAAKPKRPKRKGRAGRNASR